MAIKINTIISPVCGESSKQPTWQLSQLTTGSITSDLTGKVLFMQYVLRLLRPNANVYGVSEVHSLQLTCTQVRQVPIYVDRIGMPIARLARVQQVCAVYQYIYCLIRRWLWSI